MAVFHESDTASAAGQKRSTLITIIVIVLIVLLCCCCAVVVVALIATRGRPFERLGDLVDKNTYLPVYLTLRTLL